MDAISPWMALLAVVGGPAVVGGLAAAGIASRWLRPMMREEIELYEALADTQKKREAAAAKVVQEAVQRADGDVAKALSALGAELGGPLTKLVEESTRTLSSLTSAVTAANERSEKRHDATVELLKGKADAIEALVTMQKQTADRVDALVRVLEYRVPQELEEERPEPPRPRPRARKK